MRCISAKQLQPNQMFQHNCRQYRVARTKDWERHPALPLFLERARRGEVVMLAYTHDNVPCSIRGDEPVWVRSRRRRGS